MDTVDQESLRQCADQWIAAGVGVHVLCLRVPSAHLAIQCEVRDGRALLPIVTALKNHWQCAIAVVLLSEGRRYLAFILTEEGTSQAFRLVDLRTPWDQFRADMVALHLSNREMRTLHQYGTS